MSGSGASTKSHVVITPGGLVGLVEAEWTLDKYQASVGGLIDILGRLETTEGVRAFDMVINDEGKLLELHRNEIVTALAHIYGWIEPSDWIAGPAVFAGVVDDEGEMTSLDLDQLAEIILSCATVIGQVFVGAVLTRRART